MSGQNYNPLDKQNLGASVAQALLEQGELALSSLERFHGAGVYAIYLAADSDLYSGYSASPADGVRRPIYVGKAVPAGARKGGYGLDFPTSNALNKRIADHRKSIGQANNLTVADFSCKYLVTDDIWIALAEAVLISQFMPVWNVEIDGFGIHAPGKGRKRQKKFAWDTLHPGRPFAVKLPAREETKAMIIRRVRKFLAGEKKAEISVKAAVMDGDDTKD